MNWKEAAKLLIFILSDKRNALDAIIADLEYAIETNDKSMYLELQDDIEDL